MTEEEPIEATVAPALLTLCYTTLSLYFAFVTVHSEMFTVSVAGAVVSAMVTGAFRLLYDSKVMEVMYG